MPINHLWLGMPTDAHTVTGALKEMKAVPEPALPTRDTESGIRTNPSATIKSRNKTENYHLIYWEQNIVP